MILIPCGKCHKINAKLAQMFICVPPAGCYKSVGHARWWTCSEENGADFFHRRCRRSGSAPGADGSLAASARTEAPAPSHPRGPRPPAPERSRWALLRSLRPRPPVLPPPWWEHLLLFSVE